MSDPLTELAALETWLDEHGRSGDPQLDALRYLVAHAVVELSVTQFADPHDPDLESG